MRVLYLGPYPPPLGGIQTHLVALRRLVRKRGHEAEVINITRHRKQPADGIHYPRTALGVIRILLAKRYDVVHIHLGGMLTFRVLALSLVLTLLPGSKSVMTFHSGGFPGSEAGRRMTHRGFAGFVLRRFDAVIGVNAELVAFFLRLGVGRDATYLLEPSPPLDRTMVGTGSLGDRIQSFVDRHRPLLLTVGLLEPEYDLALQIHAVGRLLDDHPRAGLVIAGSGSLHDSLERLIADRSYADHILLCGDVPHDLTLQLMTRAAVLLRTTQYDGDALSVREALAIGLGVIATDNGMRPEGVDLVPVGDEDRLVDRLRVRLDAPVSGPRSLPDPSEVGPTDIDRVVDLYEALLRGGRPAMLPDPWKGDDPCVD